mgnify:CR=1 FL=1
MQLKWLDQTNSINPTWSEGFPDKMVILDLETTGGRAKYHRVIEIGLLVIENGRLIDTWQSFINPETIVPSFIQKLTGIKPNMVNNAPIFAAIADKLHDKLENRTWVAHNERLEYSVLKSAISRIGVT